MTVYGESEEHLADEVALVRSIAESLLVSTAPATYRALPGWLATLPLGIDTLNVRRTFDTEALAACFPFASPDLPADVAMAPGGVLYGVNTASGSWSCGTASPRTTTTRCSLPAPGPASRT